MGVKLSHLASSFLLAAAIIAFAIVSPISALACRARNFSNTRYKTRFLYRNLHNGVEIIFEVEFLSLYLIYDVIMLLTRNVSTSLELEGSITSSF